MRLLSLSAVLAGSLGPFARFQLDDAPGFPISPGRVIAGALAVAGAIGVARLLSWAWLDVCRPLCDGYVVRAIQRERANVERYLRAEVFAADLAEAAERADMSADAHRIATACEQSLRLISGTLDEQRHALESIPRLTDAVDRVANGVDRVVDVVATVRDQVNRQAGVLEALRTSGTSGTGGAGSEWDGENRRGKPHG